MWTNSGLRANSWISWPQWQEIQREFKSEKVANQCQWRVRIWRECPPAETSLSPDGTKSVNYKLWRLKDNEAPLFLFCPLAHCDCRSLSLSPSHTHTLVLLHSKCVSHSVTQLVGTHSLPPPFAFFLSALHFGTKGCWKTAGLLPEKQSSDSLDCCATVVVQQSRQRRPGRYPSFL